MDSAPTNINEEIEKLKFENKNLKDFLINYNISYPIFTTKLLGVSIGNKTFSIPNELYNNWKLYKINIYHDKFFVTALEMFFNNNKNNIKSFKFGEGKGEKKSLELENNEIIESLIINAGDLIDGITIETNKKSLFGRIENVGGNGYLFNIKEISNIFKKKIELIGFEGNFNDSYIIQAKALFKFLDN